MPEIVLVEFMKYLQNSDCDISLKQGGRFWFLLGNEGEFDFEFCQPQDGPTLKVE
jgi:hypothetical protein